MGLKVWLPLNGDLQNLGTSNGNFSIKTALTYTDNGKIGKACSGGTITIDTNTTASILNNQEFSFTCWVYINSAEGSTSNRAMFFGNSSTGANNNRKFSIFQYPTCNDLHLSWMNDTETSTFVSNIWNDVLPSYKWTHIAVTYKNPNVTIYINGIKYATRSGISNSSSFKYETYLFQNAPNQTRYLNDYRVYDECLSAAQVHEIAKGLVLHYKLDNNGMGNRNLALNSRTFSNWTVGGNWTNSIENGATVYHYERTGATSPSWNRLIPPLQLNPENYLNGITVSFDFKCDDISAIDHKCLAALQVYRADNIRVGWYEPVWDLSQVTDNKWIRLSRHFPYSVLKTNNNTSYPNAEIAYATISFQLCKNGSIYIKNVKIEDGAIATPYFVAPKDLSIDTTIVTDSSGYGHHGTINSTISYENSQGGRYSTQAYIGNETAQSVDTPNIMFENMQQGTLNIWINRKSFDTNWRLYTFFANGYNWTGREYDFLIIGSTGGQNITLDCCSNTYNFTPDLNKWYMYTISWDLVTHTAKMYVNGELKSTKVDDKIDTTYASKHNFHYFGNRNINNSTYTGDYLLSDARIYCTPLLDTDIKLLYNIGSRIDNLGGIHTYEIDESDTNSRSKIFKNGQLQSKNIYEQPALLNNATSASYNPTGANNSTMPRVLWADLSSFYKLGQPIQVQINVDVSWSNITPVEGGTFKSRIQGAKYEAATNTWVWTGPPIVANNYELTAEMLANPTGSTHVSYISLIPATALEEYTRAAFGIRTDYATGTISVSNLKITLIPGAAKINSNYVSGTEIIEM